MPPQVGSLDLGLKERGAEIRAENERPASEALLAKAAKIFARRLVEAQVSLSAGAREDTFNGREPDDDDDDDGGTLVMFASISSGRSRPRRPKTARRFWAHSAGQSVRFLVRLFAGRPFAPAASAKEPPGRERD